MNVMSIAELASVLVCPVCRGGALAVQGEGVACRTCKRVYGVDNGVLSFLVPEQLDETNKREIQGNTFDPALTERILDKEAWSPLTTQQMNWVVDRVEEMLPAGPDLFALGAGSGFELKLLLRRRTFERVFASDIAPSATALIARALADYPGQLGLFASAFDRCPVAKRPGSAGLVFQALHHAADAHAALATLLDHNFDDLVIVEPVTNRFLGLLARFDLVQRVEYTGTRPDWMHLPKIEAIARERGYQIKSQTWWEIPAYVVRPWMNDRPYVWRSIYRVFDTVSQVTNLARFGSMAAIHLTRA
jgi:uncharacterized protein YbaR (Trm112 family)